MSCNFGNMIRLCWILALILPYVQAQFPNGGFSGNGFGTGPNRFPPGGGFGAGRPFPNGGFGPGNFGAGGFNNRFPQGFSPPPNRQNGQQGQRQVTEGERPPTNPQAATGEDEEVAAERPAAAPTTNAAEAPATSRVAGGEMVFTPPGGDNNFTPPQSSFVAAGPTPDPVPGTVASIPPPLSFSAPESPAVLRPSPTATSTTMLTETVIVTASPVAPQASAIPEEEESVAADESASPTSDRNLAPLSTSPSDSMSSSARAGVGVGVTLGIIGIASITGLYLYRRRRNRHFVQGNDASATGGSDGFFGLKRYLVLSRDKGTPKDTEWSIESAAKVEIVRGASARTLSRSNSSSDRSSPPTREGVLKVGMTIPAERPRNAALTSNPPSLPKESPLSPSAFPKPPSGSENVGSGNAMMMTDVRRNDKTGSWPLAD